MTDPEITDPRDPMKRRDIVAELDRWLGVYHLAGLIDVAVIQRARDEIVALRAFKARVFVDVRDQVLEEAARVALRWQDPAFGEFDRALAIATAIRALKGQER